MSVKRLGAVWFLVFLSFITLISSLITQKWWDLRREVCLDLFLSFVSITQLSNFFSVSYEN